MKKFSFFWAPLLLLLPAAILGQSVSVGVMGGITLPKITGDAIESTAVNTGFTTGVYMNFDFYSTFGMQTGALYVQKGWKECGSSYRINYLEAPVLARLTWAKYKPYFIFGPAFAVKLNTWSEIPVGETIVTGAFDKMVASTDAGLVFGIGIYAKAPDSFIEMRYTLGLKDIDASELNLDINNSSFAILVGYSIF